MEAGVREGEEFGELVGWGKRDEGFGMVLGWELGWRVGVKNSGVERCDFGWMRYEAVMESLFRFPASELPLFLFHRQQPLDSIHSYPRQREERGLTTSEQREGAVTAPLVNTHLTLPELTYLRT